MAQNAFQQATAWSGATSRNGGSSAHLSKASEQRGRAPGDALQPLGVVADPDLGQGPDQHPGVGVAGGVHQGVGGGLLGQLAGVHDDDAVGDLVHQRQVVGDDDGALHVVAVAGVDPRLRPPPLGGYVQGPGEPPGDQQRGVEQGRDDHHHALLHPARELDRVALQHLGVEPDQLQAAQQLLQLTLEPDPPGLEQLGHHAADAPGRVHGAHGVLGDDRDLLEAEAVHPFGVPDGQLLAVQLDRPADVAHAAVQPDQALAQGRLAAAGLAGQPDQLAVANGEADPVQGLHVAAQGPVPDLEVVDLEGHRAHSFRSLGLKTSSRPTFMMYSDPTMAVMPSPGGTNHHHMPSWRALHSTALFIIRPREMPLVGPRPMKSRVAASRTAPPNSRIPDMSRYELMLGATSRRMMARPPAPLSRARSTKSRVRSENVWALTARATQGQEVRPMKIASGTTPLTRR